MHLIEYINFEIKPTPECFLVKPLRDLFYADKSKTKDTFLTQLSIVYFMADPRSSYNYIQDEKERLNAIKEQEGLPKNFKITGELSKAIDIYRKMTETASSLLLKDLLSMLEKMRKALKEVEFDEIDDLKDKVAAIKTSASIIDLLPATIKKVVDTEKLISGELEDKGRARGGSESNSIFEDGITL